MTNFSKKAQSDQFPELFLLKKTPNPSQAKQRGKKKGLVYAIIFTGAANWLQIFKIGAGAQFNSFPLRRYRWSLARTLTR